MTSPAHQQHLQANVSHAGCCECRADGERRHVDRRLHTYKFVHEYLTYVQPRIEALKTGTQGGASVEARRWYRDFVTAMHRRISSHVARTGRKHADGYLERLRMAKYSGNTSTATYFRQFAARGASCLDYR